MTINKIFPIVDKEIIRAFKKMVKQANMNLFTFEKDSGIAYVYGDIKPAQIYEMQTIKVQDYFTLTACVDKINQKN